MIKFGFQSSKYNSLTLEQELQLSVASNIDFFDIFFDDYSPKEIQNVELPQNFTVHLPIGFSKLSEEVQLEYFDFINERKPLSVTIHFAEYTFEALQKICTSIEGVPVCVENVVPDSSNIYFIDYVEYMNRANAFAKEKGFRVYSTYDTGHSKLCGKNPVEQLKILLDNGIDVKTVHLHDNDGYEDSHRPAGSVYNGIDFSSFLALLNDNTKDVYAVIEHWNNNYNALEYLRNLNY